MPYYNRGADKLHYIERGDGEPVLVVHGAVASNRQLNELTTRLSQKYRVIAPDLRGMGRNATLKPIGPTDWTDDVQALMDALGLDKSHLAGTSLGARIAMRVALDRPERVSSLTVDAPIVANEQEGNAALDDLLGADMPDEFERSIRAWQVDANWRDVVFTFRQARSDASLQEHYNLRSRVGELQVPVLVTRGDMDDAIHPIAHAVEIHSTTPSSWLWISPNTQFSAMRSRPDVFAELFDTFTQSRI